jgi:Polysaccharide lyase
MSRRIMAAVTTGAVILVVASAGASGGSGVPGQQPPKNQTPPSISGSAVVPNTLMASTGKWQGKGLKFAYQWLRCDSAGASCSAMSGATGSAKTLSTPDVGSTLRVIVTASNRNGSAAATSAQTAVVAPAGSPSTSSVPSIESLPTVSGTAQQNQTLSASTGSWSGTTPMTYRYQWQRCGAGGGSCAPISGATAASYILTAADVGSTLRASVTASNSAGSTSASSDPTAVVTSTTEGVTSISGSGYYYSEQFDGAFSNSFWQSLPGGSNSFIADGPSGSALRVTDCASSSSSNHCSGSQSNYGQEGGVDVVSLPSDDRPHTGRVPGSGTNCCDGDGQGNADTWYRTHVRFPTGYAPTPGFQNVVWEAHVDRKTQGDASARGSAAYSPAIAVEGQGNTCPGSPPYCSTQGTQPRFAFQVSGGSSYPSVTKYYPLPLGSLQLNHWYDIVVHVFWSPDPSRGRFQVWIDGSLVLDLIRSTLYVRQNGTLSYAQNIGLYNYRLWANFASSVDFDEMIWGPTATSVGVS